MTMMPSRQIWAAIAAIAMCFVVGLSPAMAQDAYSVSNIRVDATAKSASEARAVALKQGFRKGFERIKQRNLTEADAARVPTPDDAALSAMIASFSIDNERTSATRYLSSLSIRFKPDAVRQLYAQYGASYSESASQKTLVVPLLQSGEGLPVVLWGNANPWREAWRSVQSDAAKVPVRVAADTASNQRLISAQQADAKLRGPLMKLAGREGADTVSVVKLVPSVPDASGFVVVDVVVSFMDALDVTETRKRYRVTHDADGAWLNKVANAVYGAISDEWKQKTLVSGYSQNVVDVIVPVSSLSHWIKMKKKIDQVSAVRQAEVLAVAVGATNVRLTYQGTLRQLTLSLYERGLTLNEMAPGRYAIMERSASGRAG